MTKPDFKITLDEAVTQITAYVKQFELDKPNSNFSKVIGGTIRINKILRDRQEMEQTLIPEQYRGLVGWFCLDPYLNSDPIKSGKNFFLSFEVNNGINMDLSHSTHAPDKLKLTRPFDVYIYNHDTDEDIKNLLTNHDASRTNDLFGDDIDRGDKETDTGTVINFMANYNKNGPHDPNGKPYNEFPFGLFENKKSGNVGELLDQDGGVSYLRYYFGYDPSKKFNRIRVILIGVDENFKNMIPANSSEIATSGGPYILQKSWPPDEN